MPSNKWLTLLPSFMYHLDTQELRICPSLSMEMCSFLHPLLRFFPDDQGPSPWMLKPVLSTMRWSGWLFCCWADALGMQITLTPKGAKQ